MFSQPFPVFWFSLVHPKMDLESLISFDDNGESDVLISGQRAPGKHVVATDTSKRLGKETRPRVILPEVVSSAVLWRAVIYSYDVVTTRATIPGPLHEITEPLGTLCVGREGSPLLYQK